MRGAGAEAVGSPGDGEEEAGGGSAGRRGSDPGCFPPPSAGQGQNAPSHFSPGFPKPALSSRASSTHFVHPCRQHWHLHCVAMTWDHTPQKHLTLPKSSSSSPHPPQLYFYLLSRKSGCWTATLPRPGMLHPPVQVLMAEAAASALLLRAVKGSLVFLCLPGERY